MSKRAEEQRVKARLKIHWTDASTIFVLSGYCKFHPLLHRYLLVKFKPCKTEVIALGGWKPSINL